MDKKQNFTIGIIFALLSVSIVFITEQFIQPEYTIKSLVKIMSFMSAILFYKVISRKELADIIRLHKIKNIKPILIFMICFFVGVTIAFFLFRDFLDLQSIKQSLLTKEKLTKENCIFVFLYIIFCNSFLEESFFRGFVSGIFSYNRIGRIFSAILFSFYHIGIFISWFDPFIFVLSILGLTAVGLFLQWLSEKFDSILASYITHACANVAINIIGTLLIFDLI